MTVAARVPIGVHDPELFREAAYIDGAWVESGAADRTLAVDNPATGEMLGRVPGLGAAETTRAVEAAARAFPAWRDRTAGVRAQALRRWADLMLVHQDDLARLLTLEQGKPLAESRGEVGYAASFLEWFGEEAKRVYGDTIPSSRLETRTIVLKQPIGVVACITPWNFPLAMVTRKAGPAIASGCTVVLKPAPETPFSALALAALAERAGIPAGVFNVVTGPASEIGPVLTGHPAVRKLSFTGSTAVGRLLMAQCAPTVKKLSLELGGHAPFLVFEDADLDAAVEGAVVSKYRNSGQTCVCANRLLVHDGIYDEFSARLASAVSRLRPGPGLEPESTQGPLITELAVEKVEAHVRDAVAHGARVVVGGRRHARGGRFFEPTVLSEVTPAMAVTREETFGPVAPLLRVHSDEEAVRLANDTEYGLAAYVFSRDLARVWCAAEGLEYGMVGVNTGVISTEGAPFGGMKQSGLGREGSKYGIDEFLEIKYVCLGGLR